MEEYKPKDENLINIGQLSIGKGGVGASFQRWVLDNKYNGNYEIFILKPEIKRAIEDNND